MKWDPSKYVEFGNHRDRPFHDLVARVRADEPRTVIDLGCGPGNLTATLVDRWPEARVVGLDSSEEMLRKAQSLREQSPQEQSGRLTFQLGDVTQWVPPDADTDVVVTNAVLQWIPGHQEMLAGWLRVLKPGGMVCHAGTGKLHVAVPHPDAATGRIAKVVYTAGWRASTRWRCGQSCGLPGIMLDAGCAADAWETTYQQVLQGEDPVLEWVRGTGLRPILAALTPVEASEFEAEYSALLREAYPSTIHGTVYPFRRVFAVAQKAA